jgi:hypothetical protein
MEGEGNCWESRANFAPDFCLEKALIIQWTDYDIPLSAIKVRLPS